jgi:hypothetical protein
MTDKANFKLQLKKPSGWFPAGDGFLKAMKILPDGPFKLFVFLCLKADRHSASCQSTYQELAAAIGKKRHTAEAYVAELRDKGVCTVVASHIPYVGTTFRIADEYWPFVTSGYVFTPDEEGSYVESVRKRFMTLGCTSARFSPSDERLAGSFEQKGIPLAVIEDAMLVGACRKYVSWLNSGPSAPISSLHYFEPIIEEVMERPFPTGYRDYMRLQMDKLARLHAERAEEKGPEDVCSSAAGAEHADPAIRRRRDDVDPTSWTDPEMEEMEELETPKTDQKIAMGAKNR